MVGNNLQYVVNERDDEEGFSFTLIGDAIKKNPKVALFDVFFKKNLLIDGRLLYFRPSLRKN